MKKLVLFIVTFFCLLSITAFSQVQINLRSGEKYSGIILNNSNDSITIKTTGNTLLTFAKQNIDNIETLYSNIKLISGKSYTGHIMKQTENDVTIRSKSGVEYTLQRKDILAIRQGKESKDIYGMFGVTFLLPGGYNILGGYQFQNFGVRAEVGCIPYGEGGYGAQANILLNLTKTKSFEANLSIAAGYSLMAGKDYTYAGPCIDMNAGGFFVELGLGFGSGSFSSPQFLFQLGYVGRFN